VANRPLGLLDDYLERTTYRPGGTDQLAVRTPIAFNRLNDRNHLPDQLQSAAPTNAGAQTAPIAFGDLYDGHLSHVRFFTPQV
jgi:hypothetical protein